MEVHVSTQTGHDQNSGTSDQPLATIAKALEKTRDGTGSKIIYVHPGEYFLHDTLELKSAHNHVAICGMQGQPAPVIYGGIKLENKQNWKTLGSGILSLDLPQGRTWDVRYVLVNGVPAKRSRFPIKESDFLALENEFSNTWKQPGGGWLNPVDPHKYTDLVYKSHDIPSDLDFENCEITVFHMWDDSTSNVKTMDRTRRILSLDPPTNMPIGCFNVKKYCIWNSVMGLKDSPGRFAFDKKNHRILYNPLPGQDINNIQIIVPTVEKILDLKGDGQEWGQLLKKVTLRNLAFSVTNSPMRKAQFAARQCSGAVSFTNVAECLIESCTVQYVAGHGIRNGTYCSNVIYRKNIIQFCGAGGIYAPGYGILVENNLIHHIGLDYPAAIGICEGWSGNNTLRHNEIHDCSYSGVNYGGKKNVIEDNLVYKCMKTLHDGGGIYLYDGKDCIIRRNVVRDISACDVKGFGTIGYYLDEGCQNCVVENNLSLNVFIANHHNQAYNNIIRNNVFANCNGDVQLSFLGTNTKAVCLQRNIVHSEHGKVIFANPNSVSESTQNIMFGINTPTCPGFSKENTGFRDIKNGDLTLLPNSAPIKLGFSNPPIDISKAGIEPHVMNELGAVGFRDSNLPTHIMPAEEKKKGHENDNPLKKIGEFLVNRLTA